MGSTNITNQKRAVEMVQTSVYNVQRYTPKKDLRLGVQGKDREEGHA